MLLADEQSSEPATTQPTADHYFDPCISGWTPVATDGVVPPTTVKRRGLLTSLSTPFGWRFSGGTVPTVITGCWVGVPGLGTGIIRDPTDLIH